MLKAAGGKIREVRLLQGACGERAGWLRWKPVLLVMVGLGLFWSVVLLQTGFSSNPYGNPGGLVFALQGPNDGEPINSRVDPVPVAQRHLRLSLSTSYQEYGSLGIHINGRYLYSRSLQAGASWDGSAGLLKTVVDVDLLEALKYCQEDSAGIGFVPLKVTVYLYNAATFRLVTFAEWQGRVAVPWLEFLPSVPLLPGFPGLGTRISMVAHPLSVDTYFFVFASSQREVLSLSPESPRLVREARMLAGGVCDATVACNRAKDLVYLDRATDDASGKPMYVVVWSYDASRGWKRSSILPAPR